MYLIVDHPFNRSWYPALIGRCVMYPPSYAIVRKVER